MSTSDNPQTTPTPEDDTVRTEQTEQLDLPDATRPIEQTEPAEAQAPAEPAEAQAPAEPADQRPPADHAEQGAPTDHAEQSGEAEKTGQTETWPPPTPEAPRGPHAPAIVLGVVCLAVAIIVLAQEIGSLTVDWGDVGPLGIVAAGALLVVFGVIGLLTSRRNQR